MSTSVSNRTAVTSQIIVMLFLLQGYFFLHQFVYNGRFWEFFKKDYDMPDEYFRIGLCLHLLPLAAALMYALYALIKARGRCHVSVK